MAKILKAEAAVTNVKKPRFYRICPGSVVNIKEYSYKDKKYVGPGQPALDIYYPNFYLLCATTGRVGSIDNNCEITGGTFQIDIKPAKFANQNYTNYSLQNINIEGFKFTGASESNIFLYSGSIKENGHTSGVTVKDCIFSENTNYAPIWIIDYMYASLRVENSIFDNNTLVVDTDYPNSGIIKSEVGGKIEVFNSTFSNNDLNTGDVEFQHRAIIYFMNWERILNYEYDILTLEGNDLIDNSGMTFSLAVSGFWGSDNATVTSVDNFQSGNYLSQPDGNPCYGISQMIHNTQYWEDYYYYSYHYDAFCLELFKTTDAPTATPTFSPTATPTVTPTSTPSAAPTVSHAPTISFEPSSNPSSTPSVPPTANPTSSPTLNPTETPTLNPTETPTSTPTFSPTMDLFVVNQKFTCGNLKKWMAKETVEVDVDSCQRTCLRWKNCQGFFYNENTGNCFSLRYDPKPLMEKATKSVNKMYCAYKMEPPTPNPTLMPTIPPTDDPTVSPTRNPTSVPTISPTDDPTGSPTLSPTGSPTVSPTDVPTGSPTSKPTPQPTTQPTPNPTGSPTVSPTDVPTGSPTISPTDDPTRSPTLNPTSTPTVSPTDDPTGSPTLNPTESPTVSAYPTVGTTFSPTASPTASPTQDVFVVQQFKTCGSIDFSSSITRTMDGNDVNLCTSSCLMTESCEGFFFNANTKRCYLLKYNPKDIIENATKIRAKSFCGYRTFSRPTNAPTSTPSATPTGSPAPTIAIISTSEPTADPFVVMRKMTCGTLFKKKTTLKFGLSVEECKSECMSTETCDGFYHNLRKGKCSLLAYSPKHRMETPKSRPFRHTCGYRKDAFAKSFKPTSAPIGGSPSPTEGPTVKQTPLPTATKSFIIVQKKTCGALGSLGQIKSIVVADSDPELCASKCGQTAKCKGFFFNANTKKCYLVRSNPKNFMEDATKVVMKSFCGYLVEATSNPTSSPTSIPTSSPVEGTTSAPNSSSPTYIPTSSSPTFIPTSTPTSSLTTAPTEDKFVIQQFKTCGNIDFSQSKLKIVAEADYNLCKAECYKMTGCEGFFFNANTRKCYLLQYNPKDMIVDAVKVKSKSFCGYKTI
eukprot:CAMPEP_0184871580 /NCGR_PEP_ID=MMETSP0580-20130426/40801_1 /TAXON_ID=1118495 /ORGANISM="Dactyliosolen fragilissimus" /LENGTH=1089 /DNA_ID=CAMNT_0027374257 /DNA_START=135 /DNA_END=3404 /DNA_ORIENTATION=-